MTVELSLGEEEVVLLARALDLPQAPQLIDPEAAPQVEAALAAAEHALLARGLLRLRPDGRLEIEPLLAGMLGTCARPTMSIVVSVRTGAGDEQVRSFHLAAASEGAVEHRVALPGVHTFRALRSDELADRLAEALQLDAEPAPDCPPAWFPHQRELEESMALAISDEAAAVGLLRQHGLADETARALARTMATAHTNGAVACLRRATGEAAGFATLAGDNGLWVLVAASAEDADGVSAEPSSAAELRERLARLCAPAPARR